jgi:hypothetical protein
MIIKKRDSTVSFFIFNLNGVCVEPQTLTQLYLCMVKYT